MRFDLDNPMIDNCAGAAAREGNKTALDHGECCFTYTEVCDRALDLRSRSAAERASGLLLNTAVRAVLGPSYNEAFQCPRNERGRCLYHVGTNWSQHQLRSRVWCSLCRIWPRLLNDLAGNLRQLPGQWSDLGLRGRLNGSRHLCCRASAVQSVQRSESSIAHSIDELCRTQLSLAMMFQGFVELNQHVASAINWETYA
jgi:hypothetical protein